MRRPNAKRRPPPWQTFDTSRRRKGTIRHDAGAKANSDSGFLSCTYKAHMKKEALVSHRLLPSILLACVLFAFPASAQTGAASRDTSKAATTAANNVDVLTPEQAKRALDTLQDDQMRARMIDTLRAIANASPQAQAAAPAPKPTAAIPLTADSL